MINTCLTTLAQQSSFWLPPQGSTSAQNHDTVFYTVLYVTGFFFFLVVTLMLTFIVRYRRQNGKVMGKGPTHNTPLEIVWTGVPLLVVILFFVLGFKAFLDFEQIPANAELVDVEARQWAFQFTYPNGAVSDKLYLQDGKPVHIQLHSADVLHSFYIPAFRVQRNAIPRRTVDLWFKPTRPGTYHVFCTQYCGNGHSVMTSEAVVLDAAAYSAKLAELANIFVDPATRQPLPYAKVGERLYKSSGCMQCHSVDGTPGQGPTWLGLYKRPHEFSTPAGYALGSTDTDEKWNAYLRESILQPGAKIVRGYQNVMPPYEAQFSGTSYKDKKLEAIIEYIKSLDNNGPNGSPRDYRPRPITATTTGSAATATTNSAGKQ